MEQASFRNSSSPEELDFCIARSEFLDAFAKLELSIRFLQDLAGSKDRSEPLAEKIALLRDPKRCPGFSERRAERVRDLLAGMEDLIDKRNTIVHSIMKINQDSSCGFDATFINPKAHADGSYHGYRLELEDFQTLTSTVLRTSENLTNPQLNS